jgi:predicted HTH domain antitoxin
MNPQKKKRLSRLRKAIHKKFAHPELSTQEICEKLGVSISALYQYVHRLSMTKHSGSKRLFLRWLKAKEKRSRWLYLKGQRRRKKKGSTCEKKKVSKKPRKKPEPVKRLSPEEREKKLREALSLYESNNISLASASRLVGMPSHWFKYFVTNSRVQGNRPWLWKGVDETRRKKKETCDK